jgi:hypothetical protein
MRSIADQVRGTRVAEQLSTLQNTDATWRAAATLRREGDREALLVLADQMLAAIAALRHEVPFAVAAAADFDERELERATSNPQMPAELVDSFRRLAESHGGPAALVRDHVGRLEEVLDSKRAAIEAESGRLRSGQPPVAAGGADEEACVIGLAMSALCPALWPVGMTLAILSCPI